MKTRLRFVFLPLACVILLFACKKQRYEKYGDYASLTSGGKKRHFILYSPDILSPDSTYPVMIALHGRFGDPVSMATTTGFNDLADFRRFHVCYPEGLNRSWADSRGTSPSSENNIDDVQFLSDLIDMLISDYNVDSQRIYISGMSNGGFMTQDIACQLSGKIAAFASVVASASENMTQNCNPVRTVPGLFILGTEDPLIPWAGGDITANEGGKVLSGDSTLIFWTGRNGCTSAPDSSDLPDAENDGTTTTLFTWNACNDSSQFLFYRVNHGGHNWPGGESTWTFVSGNDCQDFDASLNIWEFCSKYSR